MTEPGLFSRERLAGYDPDVLAGAKVALVGAGALGQNVALCLALSGVGQLTVVDFDLFEESNRTRSPFFSAGAHKAEAVAWGFLRLASCKAARVLALPVAIQEVGDQVIRWADVVISAVDARSARAYLAERTRLHARPLVEAGFDAFDLTLTAFPNASAEEPCWRCGRGHLEDGPERGLCSLYARRVESEGGVPAVQAAAQASGAALAEAAIAALHRAFPLGGSRWTVNLRSGRGRVSMLTMDPDCLGIHEPLGHAPELAPVKALGTIGELLAGLAELGPAPEIYLPSPFVRSVPCPTCGGAAPVRRPFWSVRGPPACSGACDGRKAGALDVVSVMDAFSTEVHGLACTAVGLSAGAFFEVRFGDGQSRWFSMPGELAQEAFFGSGASTAAPVSSSTLPSEVSPWTSVS